jgi:hypothetical protein
MMNLKTIDLSDRNVKRASAAGRGYEHARACSITIAVPQYRLACPVRYPDSEEA